MIWKHTKKIIPTGILLILVLYMNGCDGSKKENPVDQKPKDVVENKKTASQKTIKKAEKPNFENEALAALELHALKQDARYDADAPVIVRVELYSPRSFAVSNHNQYKAKEAEAI